MNPKRRKLFLCREIYQFTDQERKKLYQFTEQKSMRKNVYDKFVQNTLMIRRQFLSPTFRFYDTYPVLFQLFFQSPPSVVSSVHVSFPALRFNIKPNISCNQSNSAVTVATTFCVFGDSENKKKIVSLLLNPSQGPFFTETLQHFLHFLSNKQKT